jgi:hypothetical protein
LVRFDWCDTDREPPVLFNVLGETVSQLFTRGHDAGFLRIVSSRQTAESICCNVFWSFDASNVRAVLLHEQALLKPTMVSAIAFCWRTVLVTAQALQLVK